SSTRAELPMRTRIQSGFFGSSSVGNIFTGVRATLSAPRSFSPWTTFRGCTSTGLLMETTLLRGMTECARIIADGPAAPPANAAVPRGTDRGVDPAARAIACCAAPDNHRD